MEELLNKILQQQIEQTEHQRKNNELLLMLVEAMAEEAEEDPDAEPMRYMDGTPVL